MKKDVIRFTVTLPAAMYWQAREEAARRREPFFRFVREAVVSHINKVKEGRE